MTDLKTCGSLFMGFGGCALGAQQAGIAVKWGVEHDAATAMIAQLNFPGCNVIMGDVKRTDAEIEALGYVDVLVGGPPCQSHSVARSKKLAPRLDADAGLAMLDYVRVLRPKAVIVENVTPYRKSESCRAIIAGLEAMGYCVNVQNHVAADYGVPQTRRRMLIRALLGVTVPPMPQTHQDPKKAGGLSPLSPWNGWYVAVEDLLPSLPEGRFADWQLRRMPKSITNTIMCGCNGEGSSVIRAGVPPAPTITAGHEAAKYRAFIINGREMHDHREENEVTRSVTSEPVFTMSATGMASRMKAFICEGKPANFKGDLQINAGVAPCATLTASEEKHMKRAFLPSGEPEDPKSWLDYGRVVVMTPRCLARFQSFPDSYLLPEGKTLACRGIGNAAPALMMQRAFESLMPPK